MLPGVGGKYHLELETIAKTRDAYRTAAYQATGLPAAPAIMVDDELVIQGGPISEAVLDSAILRHRSSG